MKNKKLTKIFVAILSLALLVGSAIGIAVSADETDTYAIKSINVAHGDKTQILVAVDAPVSEAENIEVKYTFNGETYVAKYYKNVDIYNNGTEYPVFYTKGIGAKDCGQSVVAEAHVKGTTPASPLYKNISVAEYLFTKLYVEGYISATEGEALDKKNLYVEFIDYISSAEEVLYNYKNPGNERQLLNTKTFVVAEDAYVGQVGGKFGFVQPGDLYLNYTGTADNHIGWCISTASGEEVVFTDIVNISESARITPYCKDLHTVDFEDSEINAGVAIDWVTDNLAGQVTHTVGGAISGGITPSYLANTDITTGRIATGGTHVLVKEDATGNKYLSFKVVPRTSYTKTETSLGDRSDAPGFNIPVVDVDANANVNIWSFDATFDSTCSSLFAQIMYTNANGKNIIYPSMNASEGKTVYLNDTTGKYASEYIIASVPTSKKMNIRYEYYWAENVLQIYVDNVFVGSTDAVYGTPSKPATISFGGGSSSACGVAFDNMSAVNVVKPYVAEPSKIINPNAETFSGEYTADYIEWKCSHGTYKSEIENGKFTYGQSTEGYTLDTLFSATNLEFASGLAVNHAVQRKDLPVNGGTSTYSNVNNAKAEIVTEANGNQYLSLFAPTRVSDRDRSYGAAMVPNVIDESHTTFIYEADMRVTAGSFQMLARNNADKHVQYSSDSKEGYVTLGGIKMAEYNEWASIRIVFYTATETPIIELYVKDATGAYQLLGQPTPHPTTGNINDITSVKNISFSPDGNSGFDLDNVVFYSSDAVYTPAE